MYLVLCDIGPLKAKGTKIVGVIKNEKSIIAVENKA